MNTNAQVEYVIRVKLPSSAGYASCPSGDSDYERDFNQAIFDAKPEGFEVSWPTRDVWPRDKDGMTWVRLYLTDNKKAVEYYAERVRLLQKQVDRLREVGKQLADG